MRFVLGLGILTLLALGSAFGGEHFACNMKALTSAERTRHQELSRTLRSAVEEKTELTDGYAFRLPAASLLAAAEWVSLEHRCCPFFSFELKQAADEGPLWLRVTGSPGVKAFIRDEFGL